MDEDTTRTCYGCGLEFSEEEVSELGGKFLCKDCEENYGTCNDCGDIFHVDDMEARENGDVCCHSCFESHMVMCICCGNDFDRYLEEHNGESWGGMCRRCANNHFTCNNCDEIFHNDDYGGDGFCQSCYDEREGESRLLRGYHDHPSFSPVFHPDRNHSLYFGVEFETDNYYGSHRTDATEELFALSDEEKLFWLENDSSLDNGIELITQPCTLNYHRQQFPWKEVMEVITKHEGKGEKTSTAAIHIHFNRNFFGQKQSELYQLRLVYLFEKFRDELLTLGRTSDYLMQRSAKHYGCSLHDTPAKEKITELVRLCDRLHAVNLTNRETIEIRIFRSTLRVDTIKASIELVDFLVRLAKECSTRKLQKLKWEDLLGLISKRKYFYLPVYIGHYFGNKKQEVKEISREPRQESVLYPIPCDNLASMQEAMREIREIRETREWSL